MGVFNLKENLKRVFTGSLIQTKAIESRLHDCNIKTISKNPFNSGIMAGFGASSNMQLFVDKKDYLQAYKIVSQFLSDINLRIS